MTTIANSEAMMAPSLKPIANDTKARMAAMTGRHNNMVDRGLAKASQGVALALGEWE